MKKLRITVGKKSYDVTVEVLEDDTSPAVLPRHVPPPATPTSSAGASAPTVPPVSQPGSVVAPMAGVIKSILVKAGDAIEKGTGVVVLEAMKMENQISSPASGTVQSVNVSEGQSVAEGQVLIVLEPS